MSEPRVLVWDIETAPNVGYTWGKWDQNVLAFTRPWYVLTIAWKWEGDKKVQVLGLDDFELFDTDPRDDTALLAVAWELLNEADFVVAHNGVAFDTKKINARLIMQGFDPPTPFREIDTLSIARKNFAFTSNKLGDICQALGIGTKEDTGGFATWVGCMEGDLKAFAKMKKYNRHDVKILEELYHKLRPWTKVFPNMATVAGRADACPKCLSTEGNQIRGYRHTAVMRKVVYQCNACKGYYSSRTSTKTNTLYVN